MTTPTIDWRKDLERFMTEEQCDDPLKVLAECTFVLESLIINEEVKEKNDVWKQ